MKKILALAAVAALTAGVSAYAANPFSDVGMDHWAYQAVADLSAQGVVEGYPNGTFGGEKHITRFEVAQIVARLLAQESQLNAQQKATVEKLAAEYADELSNLGVRVNNLENKVGNVTWTGDARVEFERTSLKEANKVAKEKAVAKDPKVVAAKQALDADKDNQSKKTAYENAVKTAGEKYDTDNKGKIKDHDDAYTGRVRLNLKAQANDKIAVKARLATEFNFVEDKPMEVAVERIHAEYAPVEGLTLDFGRTDATLGGGLFYDDVFDGVVASYDVNGYALQAGYGRYIAMNGESKYLVNHTLKEREAVFVQGSTKIADMVNVGAFYTRFEKRKGEADTKAFYGVNAKADLFKGLSVDGEYVRRSGVKDAHPSMWDAGFAYVYGPATLGVHYYDVENGSNFEGSGATYFENNAKFWVASGEVAVAKDVTLKADYRFKGEQKDDSSKKLNQKWNVSLNYVF
ncbi:MAG: S-layer homology domain-containing protein [Dialister micraerophilus]|uniref:S-layer homology domain-containing protein n=1 Tax=Dialister micraerophilus TaxID=309120 RepID=UPI00254DAA31|nr:S-layer homology domain-containing protein [Dialister micraerophilus]MDK8252990.1 S-layer homology domain-containing protein [Dialister micraerophilus]